MSPRPNPRLASRQRTRRHASDLTASIDAFRRILRELRIAARQTQHATGLSPAQLFVLSAVNAAPGCSINDLAQATMTDRSSAANVVDRLVDGGFVTRAPSRADKRRASITPTARGKRAAAASAPPPTTLLIDGLKTLSESQLRALSSALGALTRGMGIADQPPGMLFDEMMPRRR